MKRNKKFYIIKDYLVSGDKFHVHWNEKLKRGETQIPEQLDLTKYYNSRDYTSHKKENNGFIDKVYLQIQKIMFGFKESLVRRNTNENKLLDYGAGLGNFAIFMSNLDYHVWSIEPNLKALKFAKEKGLSIYDSLEKLPRGLKFSAITLWHVLEHIPNPNLILEKLYERLESDGVLFIAVPNLNSYDACFYREHWAAFDVPRHIWHFTTDGINQLLNKCGYIKKSTHPL